MLVTSAQAAKLLRQLNDELRALQLKEANSCSFVAAIQEDVESVRPEYNFKEMRDAQAEVECKIRKVKHAINVFNTTTIIPDFNITIDEMLVYLPQLNAKCTTLSKMRDAMPKVRAQVIPAVAISSTINMLITTSKKSASIMPNFPIRLQRLRQCLIWLTALSNSR